MSKKDKDKEPIVPESVKKARVYAMPEKFHIDDTKSGGKNSFLIIGIIVLAVALLSVGGYFLYKQIVQSDVNDNTAVINENTNEDTAENLNSETNENINDNTNNSNSNENSNSNLNSNTNKNINSLQNLNSNTGNLNITVNENTNNLANANTNVANSQDTDFDNLTDIEEIMYGTNASISDTDGDGFPDGLELIGGYNPNGTGQLENSSKISMYSSLTGGYTILYPNTWVADDDPQNENGKIFTSDEEFVVLDIQDNPAYLSAKDWYITKSPGIDTSGISSITNWDKKLSGVKSADGLTVYYSSGNKVYILNYNINLLSEANYFTTFEMMYKSFVIGASVLTNTNTNTNSNLNLNNNTNTYTNTNTNTNSNLNNSNSLFSVNTNQNTNTSINSNTNVYGINNSSGF